MDTKVTCRSAALGQFGLLLAEGSDARAFLHAQLTNDVENLAPGRARYAGWCSPKGRLLATFLVVPSGGGTLLQLARDLVPGVAKRLSMYILRSRVKIADVSEAWNQHGFWGAGAEAQLAALRLPAPREDLSAAQANGAVVIRVAAQRFLALAPAAMGERFSANAPAEEWTLAEIRAGRPLVGQATQDRFVPQMVNYELAGAVDFDKGCYPGQEIVARSQYRGQVKRRMVRGRVAAQAAPGQELYSDDLPGQASGTVVNAAPAPEGGTELLAVVPLSALEQKAAIRVAPGGAALELLPLPYSL
jgi:hypothetical protein